MYASSRGAKVKTARLLLEGSIDGESEVWWLLQLLLVMTLHCKTNACYGCRRIAAEGISHE